MNKKSDNYSVEHEIVEIVLDIGCNNKDGPTPNENQETIEKYLEEEGEKLLKQHSSVNPSCTWGGRIQCTMPSAFFFNSKSI